MGSAYGVGRGVLVVMVSKKKKKKKKKGGGSQTRAIFWPKIT